MEKLSELYFNPRSPAAFSSISDLYREVKKRGIKITKKQVEQWLRGIDTFGITQTGRYKFKRLRTYSYCLFDLMQADLLETGGFYPKQNKNVRFVVVAVEVLSNRLYLAPLKTKKG